MTTQRNTSRRVADAEDSSSSSHTPASLRGPARTPRPVASSPTDDGTCYRGDGIHPDARETAALYCIKWGFIVCSTAALLIYAITEIF